MDKVTYCIEDKTINKKQITENNIKIPIEKESQDIGNAHILISNDVIDSVNNLSIKIDDLNKLFIEKIQYSEHEKRIVDQMHAELQKYKEDMYAQLIRPILLDLIEIRDSIIRLRSIYQEKAEGEQDIPNKIFSGYAFDIQDILEKNDVMIYQTSIGETFVPVKQKAIKKTATDKKELHGKVAESISSGYAYNDRILSAEKVAVYYYELADASII